jgi:transposase
LPCAGPENGTSKAAVVGIGFVGRAWAISFARAGCEVALWDEDREAPGRALRYIEQRLPDLAATDLSNEATPRRIRGRTRSRTRVLAAISEGLSGREAAVRFRVSASSAIRWRALERRQGNARAKPVGGDRRSEPMERHGDAIRSLVDETPDLTLEEIRTALAEQGISTRAEGRERWISATTDEAKGEPEKMRADEEALDLRLKLRAAGAPIRPGGDDLPTLRRLWSNFRANSRRARRWPWTALPVTRSQSRR